MYKLYKFYRKHSHSSMGLLDLFGSQPQNLEWYSQRYVVVGMFLACKQ